MPLADTVDTIQGFVYVLFLVYLLCIFAYILTSWIPLPYNVWVNRVQRFLYEEDGSLGPDQAASIIEGRTQ